MLTCYIKKYGPIVCAALFKDNCVYMAREGHHAIFTMEQIGVLRNAKQGFVTENGFFVNRKVGLEIAKYYNQIVHKCPPLDSLNSEDLNKEKKLVLTRRPQYKYKIKD